MTVTGSVFILYRGGKGVMIVAVVVVIIGCCSSSISRRMGWWTWSYTPMWTIVHVVIVRMNIIRITATMVGTIRSWLDR